MTDLKNLTNQEMCEYRCAECKHACFEWEDYAYYGGVTQYVSYIADCKKNCRPYYSEEEEDIECDGFEYGPLTNAEIYPNCHTVPRLQTYINPRDIDFDS